jgi:hypothetical protein
MDGLKMNSERDVPSLFAANMTACGTLPCSTAAAIWLSNSEEEEDMLEAIFARSGISKTTK